MDHLFLPVPDRVGEILETPCGPERENRHASIALARAGNIGA
jgi:hypothetical protein